MDYWRHEFDSDEQQERRNMTRNTLLRVVKRRSTRRVSSSAVSDKVRMMDCCWLPSAAPPMASTYVIGALSDGVVCLLNTSNLSKIYLFERDEGRGESRHGATSRRDEAVSVACVALTGAASEGTACDAKNGNAHAVAVGSNNGSSAGNVGTERSGTMSGRYILCLTRQRRVMFCRLDGARLTESRRLRQETVLAPLVDYPPRGGGDDARECPLVRFNASGSRLLVLLTYCEMQAPGSGMSRGAMCRCHRSCLTVLRAATPATTASSPPPYIVELPWREVRCDAAVAACETAASYALRFCGWWDEKSLLCLWSHGVVQLISATSATVVAEGTLFPFAATDEGHAAVHRRVQCATAMATSSTQGTLAVTLDDNIVACFTLQLAPEIGREGSSLAVPSQTARGAADAATTARPLLLFPTMQTYCTEDIVVRDVALLQSFTTVLAVLLDSGAVLFLDATTMQLLTYMPLDRVGATWATLCNDTPALYQGDFVHDFFLTVLSKPFSFGVVDHHTINVLRA